LNHREGFFKNKTGLNLYYQLWLPNNDPRAILVLSHGLADHSSRYQNLVNYFLPAGYAICSFDYQGHGKSEGKRCLVNRFSDYIDDLGIYIDRIRNEYPDKKIFLIGHSMGATISIAYALNNMIDGLITSGASLASDVASPILQAFAGLLSALVPEMGVKLIDASFISRDPAVVENYINDPLVYRGKIPARTGVELVNMWKNLPERFPDLILPLLVLHGSIDGLADPEGSRMLIQKSKSADKKIKIYDGFYHEIFNDPEHISVMKDIETWLDIRS
jgi:alpha-beta hydrolase superfamily lysophospholipase